MVYTDSDHTLEFLGETEGEYTGQWRDDQRHGQGMMQWPSGQRYEGRFIGDKRHHVTGKLFFPNGTIYEGGFVDEKMQGVGCLITTDGKRYTTRFIGGIAEKSGVLEYDNLVYEGECENMQPHGKGKMRLPNGDVYEGEVNFGTIQGIGKITYASGGVYIGEVNTGLRHGTGKMMYASGNVYDGNWRRDRRDGYGILFDRNGVKVYSGEWKEDRQEGKGIIKRIKIKHNVKL
jgi:hypothetical protein